MIFNPCNGDCTEEGIHCEGCGRSFEEIAEMNTYVAGLADLAKKMGYENLDAFADGVAGSLRYHMGQGH
jgi:hypothetical protein